MEANKIHDRGSKTLQKHMNDKVTKIVTHQTQTGREFQFIINEKEQIAYSIEDANEINQFCCGYSHPFQMIVKDFISDEELITVDTPFRWCCSQAIITSNNNELGTITEQCSCCVPSFNVKDHTGKQLYVIKPKTYCGGICIHRDNDNPELHFYSPPGVRTTTNDDTDTDDDDDNDNGDNSNDDNGPKSIGSIKIKQKIKRILATRTFDIDFPKNATSDEKGIIIGTSIFLNSSFFEKERYKKDMGRSQYRARS